MGKLVERSRDSGHRLPSVLQLGLEVGSLGHLDQESPWWGGRVFKELCWASTQWEAHPIRDRLGCSPHQPLLIQDETKSSSRHREGLGVFNPQNIHLEGVWKHWVPGRTATLRRAQCRHPHRCDRWSSACCSFPLGLRLLTCERGMKTITHLPSELW